MWSRVPNSTWGRLICVSIPLKLTCGDCAAYTKLSAGDREWNIYLTLYRMKIVECSWTCANKRKLIDEKNQ